MFNTQKPFEDKLLKALRASLERSLEPVSMDGIIDSFDSWCTNNERAEKKHSLCISFGVRFVFFPVRLHVSKECGRIHNQDIWSQSTNGAMQVEFDHFDHLLIESMRPCPNKQMRVYTLVMNKIVAKGSMFTFVDG